VRTFVGEPSTRPKFFSARSYYSRKPEFAHNDVLLRIATEGRIELSINAQPEETVNFNLGDG